MQTFTFNIEGSNSAEFVTNWAIVEGWNVGLDVEPKAFIIEKIFATANSKVRNHLLTLQNEVSKQSINTEIDLITIS